MPQVDRHHIANTHNNGSCTKCCCKIDSYYPFGTIGLDSDTDQKQLKKSVTCRERKLLNKLIKTSAIGEIIKQPLSKSSVSCSTQCVVNSNRKRNPKATKRINCTVKHAGEIVKEQNSLLNKSYCRTNVISDHSFAAKPIKSEPCTSTIQINRNFERHRKRNVKNLRLEYPKPIFRQLLNVTTPENDIVCNGEGIKETIKRKTALKSPIRTGGVQVKINVDIQKKGDEHIVEIKETQQNTIPHENLKCQNRKIPKENITSIMMPTLTKLNLHAQVRTKRRIKMNPENISETTLEHVKKNRINENIKYIGSNSDVKKSISQSVRICSSLSMISTKEQSNEGTLKARKTRRELKKYPINAKQKSLDLKTISSDSVSKALRPYSTLTSRLISNMSEIETQYKKKMAIQSKFKCIERRKNLKQTNRIHAIEYLHRIHSKETITSYITKQLTGKSIKSEQSVRDHCYFKPIYRQVKKNYINNKIVSQNMKSTIDLTSQTNKTNNIHPVLTQKHDDKYWPENIFDSRNIETCRNKKSTAKSNRNLEFHHDYKTTNKILFTPTTNLCLFSYITNNPFTTSIKNDEHEIPIRRNETNSNSEREMSSYYLVPPHLNNVKYIKDKSITPRTMSFPKKAMSDPYFENYELKTSIQRCCRSMQCSVVSSSVRIQDELRIKPLIQMYYCGLNNKKTHKRNLNLLQKEISAYTSNKFIQKKANPFIEKIYTKTSIPSKKALKSVHWESKRYKLKNILDSQKCSSGSENTVSIMPNSSIPRISRNSISPTKGEKEQHLKLVAKKKFNKDSHSGINVHYEGLYTHKTNYEEKQCAKHKSVETQLSITSASTISNRINQNFSSVSILAYASKMTASIKRCCRTKLTTTPTKHLYNGTKKEKSTHVILFLKKYFKIFKNLNASKEPLKKNSLLKGSFIKKEYKNQPQKNKFQMSNTSNRKFKPRLTKYKSTNINKNHIMKNIKLNYPQTSKLVEKYKKQPIYRDIGFDCHTRIYEDKCICPCKRLISTRTSKYTKKTKTSSNNNTARVQSIYFVKVPCQIPGTDKLNVFPSEDAHHPSFQPGNIYWTKVEDDRKVKCPATCPTMKNINKKIYVQSPVIMEPKRVVSTCNIFNRVNKQPGRHIQNIVKSYPNKHSHQTSRQVLESQNSTFERFISSFRTKKTNEYTPSKLIKDNNYTIKHSNEKNKANRSNKLEKNVINNIVEPYNQKDSQTEMKTIFPYIPSKFQRNISKTEPASDVKLINRPVNNTFSNKDSLGKHIQARRNKNIQPPKTSKHVHKHRTKSESNVDKTPTKSHILKSLVINLSNFMFSKSKSKKLLLKSNINSNTYHGQLNTRIGHQKDINIIKHSKSDQPSNFKITDAAKTSKSVRNNNISTRRKRLRENGVGKYYSSRNGDAAVRHTNTKSESLSNLKKFDREKYFINNRQNNNKYFHNKFNINTKTFKTPKHDEHKYGTNSDSNIHKVNNKNSGLKSFILSLSNLMFSYPNNTKPSPKSKNYRRLINNGYHKDAHIVKYSKNDQPSNFKDDSIIPKSLRKTNASTGTKVTYNKGKYKLPHNQYGDTAVRHLHPTKKKQKHITDLKTIDTQSQFIDLSRKKRHAPYMYHNAVPAPKRFVNRGAESRKTYKNEKRINTICSVRNKGVQICVHASKNVKNTHTISNNKNAIDFVKPICHKKKLSGKTKGCFFKSQSGDKKCMTKVNKGKNKGCITKRRYGADKLCKPKYRSLEKYCKPIPTCKINKCRWRRDKNNFKTTNVGINIRPIQRDTYISSGDATADKIQTNSKPRNRNTNSLSTSTISKWFKSKDNNKENLVKHQAAELKRNKEYEYTMDTRRSRLSWKKKLDQNLLRKYKKRDIDSNIRFKQRILSSGDATIDKFHIVEKALGKYNQRKKHTSTKKHENQLVNNKQRIFSSGDVTVNKNKIIEEARKRKYNQHRKQHSGKKKKLQEENQLPYYKMRGVGSNMRSKQKKIFVCDPKCNGILTVNEAKKINTKSFTTSTIPKQFKLNGMICIEKLKNKALRHLKRNKKHKGTTTNQGRRKISRMKEKELHKNQLPKYKKKAVGNHICIKQKTQASGVKRNKNTNRLITVMSSLSQDAICCKKIKTLSGASMKTPVNVCECGKAIVERTRRIRNEKLIKKQEALCDAERRRQYKNVIANSRKKEIEKKKNRKLDKKQLREFQKYGDTVLLQESMLDIAKLGISAGITVTKSATTAIQDPKCAFYNLRRAFRRPGHTLREIKSGISKSELFPTARRIKNRIRAMKAFHDIKMKLESHHITYFLLHMFDAKKRVQFKDRRRRRPQKLQYNAFISTLRKKPCLYVYYRWPRFYPQCLSLLHCWKEMVNIFLFLLATCVWSPCLLAFELCRMMLCCLLCH